MYLKWYNLKDSFERSDEDLKNSEQSIQKFTLQVDTDIIRANRIANKLLYPFYLSNLPNKKIAAAAGGCILLQTDVLEELGGFECIKNKLIDDCSLAKKFKRNGYKTWVGLTHSAISIRSYDSPTGIWKMIARTAYTQLHHSLLLLSLIHI